MDGQNFEIDKVCKEVGERRTFVSNFKRPVNPIRLKLLLANFGRELRIGKHMTNMKRTFFVSITCLIFSFSIQAQTIVGNWTVTSIIIEGDMAYSIIEPVTLNIDENGKISGNGGCNAYGGKYSFKNPKKSFKKTKQIKFTDINATRKYCERVSNTENAFFRSLREAATVVFAKDELVIKNRATSVSTPGGRVLIQNTMTLVREDIRRVSRSRVGVFITLWSDSLNRYPCRSAQGDQPFCLSRYDRQDGMRLRSTGLRHGWNGSGYFGITTPNRDRGGQGSRGSPKHLETESVTSHVIAC